MLALFTSTVAVSPEAVTDHPNTNPRDAEDWPVNLLKPIAKIVVL